MTIKKEANSRDILSKTFKIADESNPPSIPTDESEEIKTSSLTHGLYVTTHNTYIIIDVSSVAYTDHL